MSKTYLGSLETGCYCSEYFDYMEDYSERNVYRNFEYQDPFHNELIQNPDTYEVKIAATLNRFSEIEKVLKLLAPSINIRIGGAGNKAVYILDDYADYLIHTVKSMKYWDMCASEALMKAKYGIVTDKNKNPIMYDHTAKDFTIANGILFARSQTIYDLCYKRAEEYLSTLKVEKAKF